MAQTNAELRAENAALREELAALKGDPVAARKPLPPTTFTRSQGTQNDIEQARRDIEANPRLDEVTLRDPFTGADIVVTADGVREDAPEQPADSDNS
jgi:hypothetical protein